MRDLQKHLDVLELPQGASWDEVTKAYRDLIKVWHPDRFAHDETLRLRAEDKSKRLNEAVRQLRRHYRKTQHLKRSDYLSSASGVHTEVGKGSAWESFRNSHVHRPPPRAHEQSSVHRVWEEQAQPKRRYQERLITKVGRYMAYCTVGLSVLLVALVGYPAPVQITKAAFSSSVPGGARRELGDYRTVANAATKPKLSPTEAAERWMPQSKPPLLELAANCNVNQLATLLDSGAEVNLSDQNGDTALAWAARTNCLEGAKLLMGHGANANSVAKNGFTPKDWARWAKNYQILSVLDKRKL
ncbi:MAG: DnaJ domain-containing protein [Bdellovibrionota bacterium]